MRIYGNRQIKTLPGQKTRPTAARVREAVFNIWQQRLAGCRWLDVCAGMGTMGAEALCRGAAVVVGIEKEARACRVIQQNWQTVAQEEQQFWVLRGDAIARLSKLADRSFDCIYFDPPYHSGLYVPVLQAIASWELLAPDGEIAVEHDRTFVPHDLLTSWVLVRHKQYGNTQVSFWQRDAD
ncbi:MAG: 16S rRNA (guanine(966)-N(2))-methyltransferase RsmD [Jaaginema sp. PMC 1080.18]|nr:16S rRNA (guanine(966)-N(2))-methyltransferase RsmD [Jaaginema sp. PMC 1080.18]MEC4868470.1 16S rRNA (guanine(966)-N(2))-methyltransferase RsmD [Jaaginema sp. PMC 1078.18]